MNERVTLSDIRQQEREARKQLIVDAAKRVFATRPYDRVRMKEIAEEAGMATSSLYTYFTSQEDLFLEASLGETRTLTTQLEEMIHTDDGAVEKLHIIIDTFIDYIARHDSYFRMQVLFMTFGNLSNESLESMNSAMRRAFDLFDELFRELHYDGEVRHLSHFFFAALNGILVTYRKFPGHDEEETIRYMKRLGTELKEMILARCGNGSGMKK